jgi:DNA-directed RNA polymerase subunit M/transcription elongation factor TFIIS
MQKRIIKLNKHEFEYMAEDTRSDVRRALLNVLEGLIEEVAPFSEKCYDLNEKALAMEDEIYRYASGEKIDWSLYTKTACHIEKMLGTQVGCFPDDILALQYLSGICSVKKIMESPLISPNSREIIRRLFIRTLMLASPVYAKKRELAATVACQIEKSCFNHVIHKSKNSDVPINRQWESQEFVEIYSERCGAIISLLDFTMTPCQTYGHHVINRLLGLEEPFLEPKDLGKISEKKLCPQASAAERNEIARRSEQKINTKSSNLFQCSHCGERNCDYKTVQTRSLDEAPDRHCLCLVCNHRFVVRG